MPIGFAQISSPIDQRPATTSPVAVIMNQNDEISGIEHKLDKPTDIKILDSAVYVVVAPQIRHPLVVILAILTFGIGKMAMTSQTLQYVLYSRTAL